MNQHDEETIRAIMFPDGRIFQELDDGTLRPMVSRTDWARVDAMTDEEVEANALSDPDNPPWTEEELQHLKPVSNTKASDAS